MALVTEAKTLYDSEPMSLLEMQQIHGGEDLVDSVKGAVDGILGLPAKIGGAIQDAAVDAYNATKTAAKDFYNWLTG